VTDYQFSFHDGGEANLSTSERREREKAQRRQEILDAAREEFFARGFHQPTVEDVAARAEVSKGTIYLYFVSKEEILAHLLLEGLGLLLQEMEAAQKDQMPDVPEEAVRNLANAYFRFSESHPHYFRLIMAFDRGRFEEAVPRELYQQVVDESLHGLHLLADTIASGHERGVFAVSDCWQAAGAVWAAINGALVLMAHPLRRRILRSNREGLFQATLDLVLDGLRTRHKDETKEGDL